MDERCVMQHFEGSGTLKCLLIDAPKEFGAEQDDNGPQHLTFTLEVIGYDAVGQLAIAPQRFGDDCAEGVKLGPQLFLYMCQRYCHGLQR